MIARVLSALLYLLAAGAAVSTASWVAIEIVAYPAPPPRQSPTVNGEGFRVERGGQHILHLSGEPYAIGYHNGRLLESII